MDSGVWYLLCKTGRLLVGCGWVFLTSQLAVVRMHISLSL